MYIKYEKGDSITCDCEHENGVTWKPRLLNHKLFHTLYIQLKSLDEYSSIKQGLKLNFTTFVGTMHILNVTGETLLQCVHVEVKPFG